MSKRSRTSRVSTPITCWSVTHGSATKRLLCISVESTDECKTRGEEKWHCPPRGEADVQTRHPFHAKMSSRAPSKPCLIATFLLRFQLQFDTHRRASNCNWK